MNHQLFAHPFPDAAVFLGAILLRIVFDWAAHTSDLRERRQSHLKQFVFRKWISRFEARLIVSDCFVNCALRGSSTDT